MLHNTSLVSALDSTVILPYNTNLNTFLFTAAQKAQLLNTVLVFVVDHYEAFFNLIDYSGIVYNIPVPFILYRNLIYLKNSTTFFN